MLKKAKARLRALSRPNGHIQPGCGITQPSFCHFYRSVCIDFEKMGLRFVISPSDEDRFTQLFQTETALVYDAVHLFARALTDADMSQDIAPARLSCNSAAGGGGLGGGGGGGEGGTWQHGSSLLNYMKLVSRN